jgi:hypothetical protein
MLSKAEVEKKLAQNVKQTRELITRNEAYRAAAAMNEPTETPRTVSVIPTNLSPVGQGKR